MTPRVGAMLPAALVGLASAAVVVMSLAGANPVWNEPPMTLPEAAAMRDIT